MFHPIRTRLLVATATGLAALAAAGAGAASTGGFRPFVTDFPKASATGAFTPFITDFGLTPRPPGGTVVVLPDSRTSPVHATGLGWADVGVGAGLGLGCAAFLAAALGIRRRRGSVGQAGAAGASAAK